MKSIIALLLVACLAVSVYGQLPGGSVGAARAGISPAMIQALSRGGGGGMNNLFTLSAMSGNMGNYTFLFLCIIVVNVH